MSPSLRRLAAVALLPAALVACAKTSSRSTLPPATTAPTTTAAPVTGNLTVLAASSLTGAFNAATSTLESANTGLSITYNFGGSATLATQIMQGAPADVFASADEKNMQRLVDAGLVDPPVLFAANHLEIAVAPGNPKHINTLSDLAQSGISVVLGAVGQPFGDYTRQAEAAQGLNITPKSLEPDAKTAIAQVENGDADATVVYVTDVQAAGSSVTGVQIPLAQNVTATYPIAVVKASKNQAAAQAFVTSAVSGAVQRALAGMGFLPVPGGTTYNGGGASGASAASGATTTVAPAAATTTTGG